jgi:hypothetical protein
LQEIVRKIPKTLKLTGTGKLERQLFQFSTYLPQRCEEAVRRPVLFLMTNTTAALCKKTRQCESPEDAGRGGPVILQQFKPK